MQKARYRIAEHLFLDEIVDVRTYHHYAHLNKLYKLAYRVDRTLINAFEVIRNAADSPATINNYWKTYVANHFDVEKTFTLIENNKSLYQWSGLRTPASPYYTEDSLHTSFKALDIKFFGMPELITSSQLLVRARWSELGIGGLEIRKQWLHIDTRFIFMQDILKVF